MNGPEDKAITPTDDFESLAAALAPCFGVEFSKLKGAEQKLAARAMGVFLPAALSPGEIQKRIERALKHNIPVAKLPEYIQEREALADAILLAADFWNVRSPGSQLSEAQMWDIENHPSLAHERMALSKKTEEVNECERMGSNTPIENWMPTDVELRETKRRKLQKEQAALGLKLQQKVQSLGLGWPYGGGDEAPDAAAVSVRTEPASEALPAFPPEPKAPERSRPGGRPPRYDWPRVEAVLLQRLSDEGAPAAGDGGQARLEELAKSLFLPDDCPTESLIRTKVSGFIKEFRRGLGAE
jgi:hypothetical protein